MICISHKERYKVWCRIVLLIKWFYHCESEYIFVVLCAIILLECVIFRVNRLMAEGYNSQIEDKILFYIHAGYCNLLWQNRRIYKVTDVLFPKYKSGLFLFMYFIVCRSVVTSLCGVAVSGTEHVTVEFWQFVRVNMMLLLWKLMKM